MTPLVSLEDLLEHNRLLFPYKLYYSELETMHHG